MSATGTISLMSSILREITKESDPPCVGLFLCLTSITFVVHNTQ